MRHALPERVPMCKLCGANFPLKRVIEGRVRNFQRRSYCFECSPFGSGNRKKLHEPRVTERRSKTPASVRWQRKSREVRKRELVELLGGGCAVCGYNRCLRALDFHHIDAERKSFEIGSYGLLRKWQDVLREALKCIILCKNCHAEHHAGIAQR